MELVHADTCHGVSRGYIEEDGFYADYDEWMVFCEFCWDDITKLIWPGSQAGDEPEAEASADGG
jgi:hypothetical protein